MDFEIPNTLGEGADRLYALRARRYELGRQIREVEAEEAAIKEFVINTLDKNGASGVSGKVANVRVKVEDVPVVVDWDAFYTYVKETSSFDMLQKRANTKAIRDRIEDNTDFAIKAGIGVYSNVSISLTKLPGD